MGAVERFEDSLRALYLENPAAISVSIARVLLEYGCRSLVVLLPPGVGLPAVTSTIRVEDLGRTTLQNTLGMLFHQLGMAEGAGSAAVLATEVLMTQVQRYRAARAAQGGPR